MADTARLTTALSDRYTIERKLGAGGMAVVCDGLGAGFAEFAWLEPLADGSVLFCVKETEEGVTLYRVRAPGKMERLGAVSKQVVVLHVSADLRRVAVSTWQYHGDAFMRRVVR